MSLCHTETREKVVNVKCMEHWGEMRRDMVEMRAFLDSFIYRIKGSNIPRKGGVR